jgi:predicted alpha/beta-fold hydrolase
MQGRTTWGLSNTKQERRMMMIEHPMANVLAWAGALFLVAACATSAPSPKAVEAPKHSDYAREARWARDFEDALVVGDVVRLKQSNGHRFVSIWAAKGSPAQRRRAVVLLHSIGVHPDHGLTQRLRSDLHDAGYATLAIQAPILDMTQVTDANAYAGLMDEAAERIDLAIQHVREQGAQDVFLIGHTTGAWMINHHLGKRADPRVRAWAALGQTGRFSSFGANRLATLDVYPDGGSHWPRTTAPQRLELIQAANPKSEQLLITGTDLSFVSAEARLRDAIVAFFGKF